MQVKANILYNVETPLVQVQVNILQRSIKAKADSKIMLG